MEGLRFAGGIDTGGRVVRIVQALGRRSNRQVLDMTKNVTFRILRFKSTLSAVSRMNNKLAWFRSTLTDIGANAHEYDSLLLSFIV